MTTESDRLNRIADQNRRTDEVLAALERIEKLSNRVEVQAEIIAVWSPLIDRLEADLARLHAELASARTVERKDLHELLAAKCDPDCVHCALWRGRAPTWACPECECNPHDPACPLAPPVRTWAERVEDVERRGGK